jgi:hypothetical protein
MARLKISNHAAEVRFVFGYGSCEYDDYPGATTFQALVCDTCASKYVDKMKKSGCGFFGEPME